MTELSLANLTRDNYIAISLKLDKNSDGISLANLARNNSVTIQSKNIHCLLNYDQN